MDTGALAIAGVAGLGIGVGLMIGAYVVRALRAYMRGGGDDEP